MKVTCLPSFSSWSSWSHLPSSKTMGSTLSPNEGPKRLLIPVFRTFLKPCSWSFTGSCDPTSKISPLKWIKLPFNGVYTPSGSFSSLIVTYNLSSSDEPPSGLPPDLNTFASTLNAASSASLLLAWANSELISSSVLPLILVIPDALTLITRLASDMSMPKDPGLATKTSELLLKLTSIVLMFGMFEIPSFPRFLGSNDGNLRTSSSMSLVSRTSSSPALSNLVMLFRLYPLGRSLVVGMIRSRSVLNINGFCCLVLSMISPSLFDWRKWSSSEMVSIVSSPKLMVTDLS